MQTIAACPGCGEDQESFQPFESGGPLTLAIVAETLLAELPNYPAAHNRWLPARGRRLLAFSDSRREAARLGPRLTRQHETQLVRAAIARALSESLAADQDTIDYLRQELERIETQLKTASTNLEKGLKRELAEKRKQLETQEVGGSIRDWATSIGKTPLLAELLDAETAGRHFAGQTQPDGSVRPWSQREWEDNWNGAQKKITVLLGSEFSTRSSRTISAETIGLAEVTYPGIDSLHIPDRIVGLLPNAAAQCALEGAWPDVLRSLCDTLRAEGIVELDADNDVVFQTGGVPIGRWAAKHHTGWQLVRFVGSTPRHMRRRFVSAILEACSIGKAAADEIAPRLLEVAFDQLLDRAKAPGEPQRPDRLSWLERDERQTYDGGPIPAIRIAFSELGVRRPPSLFRCVKTHHVWPRSILGCAPEMGCNGTLQPVSEDQLDKDPRLGRLRQEYHRSHVFSIGLWAEEHSAQLSPRENRRLQDLFKAGLRNVLSATTTLELGIDIGGLSAVLLSNVPPGKANYLQRAGRAGRRADGSAAVVTFARSRSFDREVFSRFGHYLDQPLRKPRVFLDRQRVVRRHLHAYLLGEFFRSRSEPGDRKGAMDAFGSMGTFCGKPVVPYWKDKKDKPALGDAPSDLVAMFRKRLIELRDHGDATVQAVVTELFAGSGLQQTLAHWPKLIDEVIDSLDGAIKDWNDDYDRLCNAWQAAVEDDNKAQANAIYYQLKLLSELTVIEALADRQFLPRYGFPIGLQKLRVIKPDPENPKRIREEDQLRLERASMLAVAEYVPGSQILVGGKVITSHGLLKHWTGASLDRSLGLRGYFCQCENSHSFYGIASEPDRCPICDGEQDRFPQRLLFVKYGFTSAAWDP
ncbi:MAG: helicase-related protein, partial [Patescibacteria group bacterium]|nr:helicase-related protein [Patescibacteria group bacterium]